MHGLNLLLSLFVLLGSCKKEEGNTLSVQLRTDLVVPEEFDRVEVRIFALPDDDADPGRRFEVAADPSGYLPTARVLDVRGLANGDYRVEVALLDSARERSVIERPLLLNLDDNIAVTIPITRSCVPVVCPPLNEPDKTACLGGRCVDARCSLESPEFCDNERLCIEAADCPLQTSCAVPECRLGTCWAVPKQDGEEGACEAPAWCFPEQGCQSPP